MADEPRDTGEAINLTEEILTSTIASNEIVFIMFYSKLDEWVIFNDLPVFNAAARKIKAEFPQEGLISLGKMEYKKQSILKKFNIYSYPTFLVIRDGQPMKREFKGPKMVETLVEFVKMVLEDWKFIKEFPEPDNFPPFEKPELPQSLDGINWLWT